MSSSCGQLTALLWKNWTLKKRRFISTLFEILLPCVVVLGLVWIFTYRKEASSKVDFLNLDKGVVLSQREAIGKLSNLTTEMNTYIAFIPGSKSAELRDYVAPYFDPDRIILDFESAKEFQAFVSDDAYGQTLDSKVFMAGVILDNDVGPNYSYTIRMNSTESFSSKYKRLQGVMSTTYAPLDKLFRGYSKDWSEIYYDRGFVGLQTVVDSYFMHKSGAFPFPAGDFTMANVDNQLIVNAQPFPTPKFKFDDFYTFVGGFIGIMFALVFIWPVTRIISSLVEEKELKIKNQMKMMGLGEAPLMLSWFITYFIMLLITSIVIAAMTSTNIYNYSNSAIIFVFFFLYCISIMLFSFFISSFFSSAKTGSIFGGIIHLILFFMYYLVEDPTVDRGSKIAACLCPTICLSLGANTAAQLESSAIGVTNGSMSMVLDNFAFGDAIMMLVVDCIVFLLLGIYFQQVFPGEYGIPLPWYFPVSPKFWCGTSNDRRSGVFSCFFSDGGGTVEYDATDRENEDFTQMEARTVDEEPLLQIQGLRKTFGSSSEGFVAVKGLSLTCYKGQILGLLGENGAGKTTTISMLTGLYAPSEGTAVVDGYDLRSDMNAIYNVQGICMQHDVLYPYFTVWEHLHLYAAIKGVPRKEREEKIMEMIDKVGLGVAGDNKRDAMAGTLSGGQKRKLSVAIAFLNAPKVVYLDEPSSGVDVESRRDFWSLLLSLKKDRVIIITSHSMDEVEYLSDRIAIMAGGVLMCCGTSRFLKNKYGVGYTLTISKKHDQDKDNGDGTDGNDGDKLTHSDGPQPDTASQSLTLYKGCSTHSGSQIAQFVGKDYEFCDLTSDAAGEIQFRMPFDAAPRLPDLFDDLDDNKAALNITSYAVSVTNLTEVFLRVVSTMTREAKSTETEPVLLDTTEQDEAMWGSVTGERDLTSMQYFTRHFKALFLKRVNIALRDFKAFSFGLLYPAIILVISFISLEFSITNSYPDRVMSPTIYEQPNDFRWTNGVPSPESTSLLTPVSSGVMDDPFGIFPIDTTFPTSPVTISEMQDVLLDDYYTSEIDRIRTGALVVNTVENWPPPASPASITDVPRIEADVFFNYTAQESLPVYANLLSNTIMKANNPNSSITLLNQPFDKTAKQKAMLQSILAFSIAIAFCFVPATYTSFIVKEKADKVKHLQFVSGLTPASYWLSIYLWDVINFVVPFVMLIIFLAIFDITILLVDNIGATILVTWLFVVGSAPFTYCFSFLFEDHITAQNMTLLVNFLFSVVLLVITVVLSIIDSTRELSKGLRFVFRLFPAFCFGDALSMIMIHKSLDVSSDTWDMNVIGWDVAFGFFDVVLYLLLLAFLQARESGSVPNWLSCRCCRRDKVPYQGEDGYDDEEEDVMAERIRIQNGECDDPNETSVLLKKLSKVYPSRMGAKPHVAVNNMYLSIKKGECFGFLGANGAGKTTTMKILTGDVTPSAGNAFIGGIDLMKDPVKTRQMLGYCPQFDAINPLLTGREHLYLYARIKCLPEDKIDGVVNFFINKLGLRHLADRPSGGYSGGNKRKLSCGIALVGNPAVLILDEMSTGVDPSSRQHQQRIIAASMKNRAVILISHQLDEVESLCDRIMIMASGRARCLNTIPRLVEKYGNGYQISIQMNTVDDLETVGNLMTSNFVNAVQLEVQQLTVMYRVDKANLSLSNVFRTMQSFGNDAIASYSVSNTTLDQIFVQFVREDDERRRIAQQQEQQQQQ